MSPSASAPVCPCPRRPAGEPVETSWRQRMHISFQNLFQALVLLTHVLAPGSLAAQASQGGTTPAAATTQPPRVPELADIIPLATALSERLSNLEKALAGGVEVTRVEQQLRDISARVDGYARQFLALQAAVGPPAGRLPQLKAEIKSAGNALAGVSPFVAEKVRTLGNLRKAWLAEQQRWHAAWLQEAPLEHRLANATLENGVAWIEWSPRS